MRISKNNVFNSILALPKQCAQAWEEAGRVIIPLSYRNPRNIVVAAMGGSGLGAHIIKTVYERELRLPFEIINHYELPGYVDKSSLVFLISYSGGTEEILETAKTAKKRGVKIIGITSGGELGKWLTKHNLPRYIFEPRYNPSGQPRLGIGYTMMGMLAMLSKVAAPPLRVRGGWEELRIIHNSPCPSYLKRGTLHKDLAYNLKDRGVLIFASEHLIGNAHTLANQINESAKQFATWFPIPEMNHHLMEGLSYPKTNPKNLVGLFLKSNLYHPRVQARYAITKEIFEKQHIPVYEWSPKSAERLDQALETLLFGGLVSFYLADINRVDPSKIPWVDYFKSKLKD